VAKENNTTGEQSKEQKTKRELEAMARQRLGCAVPVRRDVKGGWYFQVIEAIGLNPGTLQRRANLLAEELGHFYELFRDGCSGSFGTAGSTVSARAEGKPFNPAPSALLAVLQCWQRCRGLRLGEEVRSRIHHGISLRTEHTDNNRPQDDHEAQERSADGHISYRPGR
jgi:hypothetical protein